MSKSILEIAQYLGNKYHVKIELVETDAVYFSDETINRSAREHVFFISKENVDTSAQNTELLIRYRQAQKKLKTVQSIDDINEVRFQKSRERNSTLSEIITTIKDDYKSDHDGKSPSLRKIAAILHEKKIASPHGHETWHANAVRKVLLNKDNNDRSP